MGTSEKELNINLFAQLDNVERLEELCEAAGLAEEWEAADGETFEAVAYKAADILKVEI